MPNGMMTDAQVSVGDAEKCLNALLLRDLLRDTLGERMP